MANSVESTQFAQVKINKNLKLKIVSMFLHIILAYVLGAQKNHLIKMVLLSTQNMFWLRNKSYFSITHA